MILTAPDDGDEERNLELMNTLVISISYMMASKIYYSGKDIAYSKKSESDSFLLTRNQLPYGGWFLY